MIRINLLAGSAAPPPPRGSVDVGQRVTLACSVILVAMVVVIGWRFWSLRQESNQVQQELTAADQEIGRLGPVVDQVGALDAERGRLEQTVGLIQVLRSGQSGPVHVLDELSRAMPVGLWLAQLEQDADIVVEGRTFTLGALSDFMANLEGSGFFNPPVEIIDSQLEETEQGEVVRFELRAEFVVPGS